MSFLWAKTTIFGCFFNKNARKWYFKKNSLGHLNFYTMVHFEGPCDHIYLEMKKWPYLSPGAENEQNKTTFFSTTSKVWENKVGLFYSFLAPGPRYGHFLIFSSVQFLSLFFETPFTLTPAFISPNTQMCYVETDQILNLPAPQGLPGGNGH